MSSDLFGDITTRVPSAVFRGTRRSVIYVSITAHAVVFVAALFFSLTSPGLLPAPRTALAYFERVEVMDIDLPAPARPAATAETMTTAAPTVPLNDAPVVAPIGITPEPGFDVAPAATRSADLSRIESGSRVGPIGPVMRVEQPAPAIPQTPVRLHLGMQEPVKLVHVDPIYPPHAQSARVQGVVILEAVIDAAGRVDSVHVLRSIMLLDQSAIAAVRQWRYRPAMLNGSPVPVIVTITVNFKMDK